MKGENDQAMLAAVIVVVELCIIVLICVIGFKL